MRDSVKIVLKEIGWESVDWINLAQESENFKELSGSIKS
jgi:hypothetical protein